MDRMEDGDWGLPVVRAAAGAVSETPGAPASPPAPRRVRYSEDLGWEICARLAAGESLMAICREPGMPHHSTVRDWRWRREGFGEAMLIALRAARYRRRRADLARAMRPRDGRGRWSTYSHEVGAEICRRLMEGETLIEICRGGEAGAMPCYSTVLNWARAVPEFGDAYAMARRLAADYLFDEARELAKASRPGTVWVDRLRFAVIRWQVARLGARKYVEAMPEGETRAAVRARKAADEAWQNVLQFGDDDGDDDGAEA